MNEVELVRDRVAELEEILKQRFSAEGKGLGQYVKSIESSLPTDLVNDLMKINGIRNKIIHEQGARLYNPDDFIRKCDRAKTRLDSIAPGRSNRPYSTPSYSNRSNYSDQSNNSGNKYLDALINLRYSGKVESNYSHVIIACLYIGSTLKNWYAKLEIVPQWVVISTLGYICSGIATAIIVNVPFINALPSHLKNLLGLAVFLWGLGKAQETIIIKLFGELSKQWAVATMAASIPIYFIYSLDSLLSRSFNRLPLSGVFLLIFICGVIGLSIGGCQWFIIKQHRNKFSWWSISNILQVLLAFSGMSISMSTYGFSRTLLAFILLVFSPGLSSIITGLALKKIVASNSSRGGY